MENLLQRDDAVMEIINGKVVFMSPTATTNHNAVAGNIYRIFGNYLLKKKCRVFGDGVTVNFDDRNRTVPDMTVVCNPDIIKYDGIHGVPDLIVEVLSPSTAARDKGIKKDMYEQFGVKEYWIVNTDSRSIDVNLFKNERYVTDNVYSVFNDYDLALMTDEDKEKIIKEFKTSIFDDLVINIEDVFENVMR